jgi:hypothetical protein
VKLGGERESFGGIACEGMGRGKLEGVHETRHGGERLVAARTVKTTQSASRGWTHEIVKIEGSILSASF